MLKRLNKCLVLILFLALVLRLIGIGHGFPFIFHPDEPATVRSALSIRFYPNPKHFDWPHFYIYLNYFLYMIFARFRDIAVSLNLKDSLSVSFPLFWNDDIIFYLLTRVFSAVLGASTVIPIYLTGKKLFGKSVGLFGALAIALMPFHVSHSHYALIDIPMVFFLAWSLYFSSQIFLKGRWQDYVLAGVFMGFAASTKYHGALGTFVIVLAHLLRLSGKKFNRPIRDFLKDIKKLLLAGGCSIAAFLVGTPYALLDFATFRRTDGPAGAFWQFTNVGSVSFGQRFLQFGKGFLYKFPSDMSPIFVAILVLVLVEVLYLSFVKRTYDGKLKKLLFFMIPAFCFLLYISGFVKNRSHYYMISYPFIALSVGYFVNAYLSGEGSKPIKRFITFLVFLLPFVMSVKVSCAFMRGDTRLLLSDWLKANVTEKEVLIYDGDDLRLLFEDFENNTVRKSKDVGVTDLMNFEGFLIVSMEEDMSISVFDGRVPLDVLIDDSWVYELLADCMRGPSVRVYKLPVIK